MAFLFFKKLLSLLLIENGQINKSSTTFSCDDVNLSTLGGEGVVAWRERDKSVDCQIFTERPGGVA